MNQSRSLRRASAFLVAAMVLSAWQGTTAGEPSSTTPALSERLDRLAAEIERNRVDLHVPGVALAIVRGDQVIYAKGFGLADVSKKTPVTPQTQFFIGSTTKAFTATVIGMLVDEGRMGWDDPVEKYLPEFKLKVQSDDPNARVTLRDVLSHRTGFTRPVLLDWNNGLSSEEILRQASTASAFAPFRQKFLYNNENYVAAGSAAAVAAGMSWNELVQSRILTPLGMTATRTTREAWNEPRMARGYWWDAARKQLKPQTLETQGLNIDGLAPAGAISSTALDMAAWLRFLLRQGVHDGKALISPASLTATWTPQIPMSGPVSYGMGWMLRDWQGQRLIEHGGALTGFSAEVGLLPDSDLGFVVLTNSQSSLPSIVMQLVPQYLLGDLPPVSKGRTDPKPYIGRYVASFTNDVFTIFERNGRLVLDIPSQLESALNPPRADGRWSLVMTDQMAVSFDRDEKARVVGLRVHQGGQEIEVPRELVAVASPPAELQKYLGRYADAQANEFAVFVQNQRLAVRLPNDVTMDLNAPDAAGRRTARTNSAFGFVFEESPTGVVTALNIHRPGALQVIRTMPLPDPLPTVAEIMKLRRITSATAIETLRSTGRVRYAQSGVEGRFTTTVAGDRRLRTDMDFGRFGQLQIVLNDGRGWSAAMGLSLPEQAGKELRQAILSHPLVQLGDWRKHYDAVRVLRAAQVSGRKIYVVQLESVGLPPTQVNVDAETGDVLREERKMVLPTGGAFEMTTVYSDYREIGGMRLPYRTVTTTEPTGRIIQDVEKIEAGVRVSPRTFRPSSVR